MSRHCHALNLIKSSELPPRSQTFPHPLGQPLQQTDVSCRVEVEEHPPDVALCQALYALDDIQGSATWMREQTILTDHIWQVSLNNIELAVIVESIL